MDDVQKFFYDAIPGLQSFMESADVEVKVKVGDSDSSDDLDSGDTTDTDDTALESEETADETSEVEEADKELNETTENAEMILQRFRELNAMREHLKLHGLNRSFLSLMNRNGILSHHLHLELPAMEVYDVTGFPTSTDTQLAVRGLNEYMAKARPFIYTLSGTLGRNTDRLYKSITKRISSVERNLDRVNRAYSKLHDTSKLHNSDKLIYSLESIKTLYGDLNDEHNSMNTIFYDIKTLTNSSDKMNYQMSKVKFLRNGSILAQLEQLSDNLKKVKRVQNNARIRPDMVPYEHIAEMTRYAREALNICTNYLDTMKDFCEYIPSYASHLYKGIEGNESLNDNVNMYLFDNTNLMMYYSKVLRKITKQSLKIATLCTRNASQRLAAAIGR